MTLAFDIGASNIRVAEVSGIKIKNRKKIKTPKTKKETIDQIINLIKSYKKPNHIAIAIAGFERNGKITNAINMKIDGTPLRKILKSKIKVPIYLDNDANCAGLAELHFGAGRKMNNFILLTLGTGIGCAIIINKSLYKGRGGGGEIGSAYFGDEIFEKLASGSSTTYFGNKVGLKGVSSFEIANLAQKKNKKALKVFGLIGENLGKGLANISYIFDPDAIILGGGFSQVKYFYPKMNSTYKRLYEINPKTPIIKAKFGDDAGLIGAALLSKYH